MRSGIKARSGFKAKPEAHLKSYVRSWLRSSSSGIVTLEACITVVSFMLLMLTISTAFTVFSIQNATAHALYQTVDSLALDAYATSRVSADVIDTFDSYLSSGILALFFNTESDSPHFISQSKWYDSGDLGDVLKKRFVGYLGENEDIAHDFLVTYRVKGGLSGLDFKTSELKNGDLTARLSYTIGLFGGLADVPVEQKAVSRLLISKAYGKSNP